jgi:hypothetical protein
MLTWYVSHNCNTSERSGEDREVIVLGAPKARTVSIILLHVDMVKIDGVSFLQNELNLWVKSYIIKVRVAKSQVCESYEIKNTI